MRDASTTPVGATSSSAKSTVRGDLTLKGLKIVVDAAHGAAYHVAPDVLHELGAEVVEIGCRPNGVNINAGFGATAPAALQQAVRDHRAHYGIALDGDADRLQVVDSNGMLYNGDQLLYVMVMDRLNQGLPVPGVVGTLMTNLAVESALRARGVEFVRTQVGDRYVLEALGARGWDLGGEGSGHLLALDKHTTGDGLVSALQVLQAIQHSGKSLAQLLAGVVLMPQVLLNVKIAPDSDWTANALLAREMQAVSEALGDEGRILIRASGTEPVLRIMVEARDGAMAERMAVRLVSAAKGAAHGASLRANS